MLFLFLNALCLALRYGGLEGFKRKAEERLTYNVQLHEECRYNGSEPSCPRCDCYVGTLNDYMVAEGVSQYLRKLLGTPLLDCTPYEEGKPYLEAAEALASRLKASMSAEELKRMLLTVEEKAEASLADGGGLRSGLKEARRAGQTSILDFVKPFTSTVNGLKLIHG